MWIEQQRSRPGRASTSQPRRAVRTVQRSSKGDATRRRILNAAMSIVADEGYHAATHQRIAQAAGLVRTAVNYHFPDPDRLSEALILHLYRLKAERVAATIGLRNPDGHSAPLMQAYWALLGETPFVAIAELECCARTDSALRTRLAAARVSSDQYPPSPEPIDRELHELSVCLLEGMARGRRLDEGVGLERRLLEILTSALLVAPGD